MARRVKHTLKQQDTDLITIKLITKIIDKSIDFVFKIDYLCIEIKINNLS